MGSFSCDEEITGVSRATRRERRDEGEVGGTAARDA